MARTARLASAFLNGHSGPLPLAGFYEDVPVFSRVALPQPRPRPCRRAHIRSFSSNRSNRTICAVTDRLCNGQT
jgi:hypothetical protein